jgi:hypothetical protein
MGASAEDADCSSRREHPTRDQKDDDAKPDRNVAERGAISKPVEAVCKPCVNLVLELVVGMPTIVLSGPGIRRLARGADSLRHNVPLRLLRQASGPLFRADIPQFRERRVNFLQNSSFSRRFGSFLRGQSKRLRSIRISFIVFAKAGQ